MKRVVVILFFATALFAQQSQQSVLQQIAEDAIVFDRVAEVSKRDLPRDLLERIIVEDIEMLRGRRADGTYQYATFERFDSGRINDGFSIQPRGETKMETVEVKGDWVYRVILEVPTRKMLVRRNQKVWIERVDLDYVGQNGTQNLRESIEIKQWLQPGEFRPVDFPDVARRATVRVVATAEEKGGYGNMTVSLVKARIVDNADSPYADIVASAKAVQRALENGDLPSIRAMAQRMRSASGTAPAVTAAVRPAVPQETTGFSTSSSGRLTPNVVPSSSAANPEIRNELQTIEDLLTGSEQERREGMDRLHQLIRRMRQ